MIKWFEKNKTVSVFMIILIAIEIFFFSSIPGTSVAGGSNWIARAYHFIIFFLFSFFMFVTIKGNKKIKANYIFIVLIISLIYASLDEFHQLFVPFRSCNITDILTDSLGIFFSIIIYHWINRRKNLH